MRPRASRLHKATLAHDAAEHAGDGHADDAELGKSAKAKQQQAVADDIDDVLSEGHKHGVAGVGVGAQSGGDGDIHGLEEQRAAHKGQERFGINQRPGRDLHEAEHGSREHA